MLNHRRLFLLPLVMCLVACRTHFAGPQSAEESVRSLQARFAQVFLEKDWEGLGTLYTPQAVLMPPNAPSITGSQNIVAYFAGTGITISHFEISSEEIAANDRMAMNRGTYAITFTAPGMTGRAREEGKYLWVLRPSPNGGWQIAVDMFSSNRPVPGAN